MIKILLRLIYVFTLFLLLPGSFVIAAEEPPQEKVFEGKVVEVLPSEEGQKLKIELEGGDLTEQVVEVDVAGATARVGEDEYEKGDLLLVNRTEDREGNFLYYVRDFVRRPALLWLFIVFGVLTVLVARWRGAASLLGMAFSFLIIFKFILPRILAGSPPVFIILFSSLFIIPVTFFLSHGVNRKSLVAIGGTLISLLVTVLLAVLFSNWAHLTGFSSEEAAFLETMEPGQINFRGLVLAGMIVGVLGVLDDITVAQAAVVEKLREANPRLSGKDLFFRALDVGRDHIASMVNTLVLVYAGASLPLLLLFVDTSQSLSVVINNEALAVEIIRTLVGSIGLIFAVPVTAALAVKAFPCPFSS